MLLTALLILQVNAEWVEISQQHYRKPLRAYTTFATPYNPFETEDTTKPWTYNNHSISAPNWNEDVIKREQPTRSDARIPILPGNYEPGYNYGPIKAVTDGEHDVFKGTVEIVPNVGNVRRVQLTNSPVKSPNIKMKMDRDKNRFVANSFDYKDDDEDNDFENNMPIAAYNKRMNIKTHSPTRTPFLSKSKDDIKFTDKSTDFNKNPNESTNPTEISSGKQIFRSKSTEFRSNKKHEQKESNIRNKNNVVTTKSPNFEENGMTEANNQDFQNGKLNHTELKTKHNKIRHSSSENSQIDPEITIKSHDAAYDEKVHSMQENLKQNLKIRKANATKTDKLHTLEEVMKFIMVVANTISKNSQRSFNGKMRYLQELKENILANIEARIDAAWPDDPGVSGGERRRSRSARAPAKPRGHVQFPSSESTLMTISFLTFAVFLIKLVLQVIQTYKNKAMMVAPLVVTAGGRAAFAHRSHN